MRRAMQFLLPIIILSISILVMNGGEYLKKPINDKEDVAKYMDEVKKDIQAEKWDDAKNNAGKLKTAWEKIIPRIQFSVERYEINDIGTSLSRLEGALDAKDKANALIELSEAYKHWNSLEK